MTKKRGADDRVLDQVIKKNSLFGDAAIEPSEVGGDSSNQKPAERLLSGGGLSTLSSKIWKGGLMEKRGALWSGHSRIDCGSLCGGHNIYREDRPPDQVGEKIPSGVRRGGSMTGEKKSSCRHSAPYTGI